MKAITTTETATAAPANEPPIIAAKRKMSVWSKIKKNTSYFSLMKA